MASEPCACIDDRGPNYFEVDIDVGSSKSAASVVGLVQGALKGLVIDMAITMEGHTKVTMRCVYLQTVGWLGPILSACMSNPVWSLCCDSAKHYADIAQATVYGAMDQLLCLHHHLCKHIVPHCFLSTRYNCVFAVGIMHEECHINGDRFCFAASRRVSFARSGSGWPDTCRRTSRFLHSATLHMFCQY